MCLFDKSVDIVGDLGFNVMLTKSRPDDGGGVKHDFDGRCERLLHDADEMKDRYFAVASRARAGGGGNGY